MFISLEDLWVRSIARIFCLHSFSCLEKESLLLAKVGRTFWKMKLFTSSIDLGLVSAMFTIGSVHSSLGHTSELAVLPYL